MNERSRRPKDSVRTKTGVDIASGNHLVLAKLKLNFKELLTVRQVPPQVFCTPFLCDTNNPSHFEIDTGNKFQVLYDLLEVITMESNWKWIKEAMI